MNFPLKLSNNSLTLFFEHNSIIFPFLLTNLPDNILTLSLRLSVAPAIINFKSLILLNSISAGIPSECNPYLTPNVD